MTAQEKPKLKFRSYNPQTESLKEGKLPKAEPECGMCVYDSTLFKRWVGSLWSIFYVYV